MKMKAMMVVSLAVFAATAAEDCVKSVTVPGEAASLLPAGKKFKLVWNDEFNGDRLDESKWSYRTNFWGRRISRSSRSQTASSCRRSSRRAN